MYEKTPISDEHDNNKRNWEREECVKKAPNYGCDRKEKCIVFEEFLLKTKWGIKINLLQIYKKSKSFHQCL